MIKIKQHRGVLFYFVHEFSLKILDKNLLVYLDLLDNNQLYENSNMLLFHISYVDAGEVSECLELINKSKKEILEDDENSCLKKRY